MFFFWYLYRSAPYLPRKSASSCFELFCPAKSCGTPIKIEVIQRLFSSTSAPNKETTCDSHGPVLNKAVGRIHLSPSPPIWSKMPRSRRRGSTAKSLMTLGQGIVGEVFAQSGNGQLLTYVAFCGHLVCCDFDSPFHQTVAFLLHLHQHPRL